MRRDFNGRFLPKLGAVSLRTVSRRVARTAKQLDKSHPGWADRINLDKFDINNCLTCVVGQLNLPYDDMDETRGFWATIIGVGIFETASKLNPIWRRAINKRRMKCS